MSTDSIQIKVLREAGTWKIKYDGVVLEYETHPRALAASIELAHTLGREGHFVSVVMGMITSLYGPNGFIQTRPNRKKSDAVAAPVAEQLQPLFLELPEVEGSPLVPETPPESPAERPLRKLAEEREPRLMRIALQLAALDKA